MATLKIFNKHYLASWLTMLFGFSLLVLVVFSEFFQNTAQDKLSLDLLTNPIRADIVANIKTIRIQNRLGTYTLNHENNQWLLKEPRVMPANMRTVNNILETLSLVKIETIHQYEPINLENFSLNKPVLTIDLFSKLDESLTLNVGLVNPIDNTSYLTVSGKQTIYQIEVLKNSLEILGLTDFIETSIFSSSIDEVAQFHLYQANQKESLESLTFDQDQWVSKRYKGISQVAAKDKLLKILSIKTHMIVDKIDNEIQNFIDNYLQNPLYQITIKTKNDRTIQYKISHVIKAIPELKIDKGLYFIMTSSDRQYPYIIDKNFLEEFVIRYKDIK
jgi:hypothetical protein